MKIGNVLRESRIKSQMTVEQVSKILTEQGYKASQKTVYSWESGNSRPDIEILMKLCDLYGIKDILKTFGYDGYKEDGSLRLNMKEVDMVEKYRNLDDSGKKRIDYELDRETERIEEIRKQKQYIESLKSEASLEIFPTRIWAYYGKIASAGTSVEFVDMVAGTKEYPVTDENKNADYTIGVNGDSMEPLYNDGDVVFVKHTIHLHIGDIGIFQKDNNIYIKQVGEGCLVSLNPNYDPIKINDGIRIWGKVLGKAAEPN